MHRLVRLAVALAATALPVLSQSLVVPNGFASTEGDSNNIYPWGRNAASMRIQFLYDTSHFTAQGVTGPIAITRLRWRANASTTTWAGGVWPNVQIDMSSAAVDFAAISSTFASNRGADATTVYHGPVTFIAGTGNGLGVPGPTIIDIALSNPFYWNPTNGNDLLIDIKLDGTGWAGVSTAMDQQTTGSNASRAWSTVSHTATTATGTGLQNGPILQLDYRSDCVVIPNGAANADANTSNAFPWGRGSAASLQHQAIYDSANFSAQGITCPIQIRSLRWRANATTNSWAATTYTNATVRLATAAVDAQSPLTAMASNLGPDVTTVYSGPVTVQAGTGNGLGVPGPLVTEIVLSTPFTYNPNTGRDLVIDCDIPPGVGTGGSLQLDVMGTGSQSSRIYNSSAYGSGIGTTETNHGVVVEVTYTLDSFAYTDRYGRGCNESSRSFYEFQTAAAFDLASSGMTLSRVGNVYRATAGGSYVVPPGSATVLVLGDDSETNVPLASAFPFVGGSTTSLQVCSNGFVSTAAGNGASFSPGVSAWVNSAVPRWGDWHDFNPSPTASGRIKFHESGAISYVTWDGVYDFGGSVPNFYQLQFNRSNGTVVYAWGSMSGIGNSHLTGFAAGGASEDVGSRDISATMPFATSPTDLPALTLSASARPILNTSINLVSSSIPAGTALGVTILSFGHFDPGFDLTPLGMPTCRQLVPMDSVNLFVVVGGMGTQALPIPNVATLCGAHLYAQSATFTPGANALGVLASNGLDVRVGDD